MPYRLADVSRLYARDAVFLARQLRERTRRRGRPKRFVVCNSYPKSGTHLLNQILYSTSQLSRWDNILSVRSWSGMMNTRAHLRSKLWTAPDGAVVMSHLTYGPDALEILAEHETRRLFIYRDLRDVAASHARWVSNEPRHFLHDIYTRHLLTEDERLLASIVGTPLGTPFGSNVSHPDIGTDFARWQPWIDDDETLAVRFEDLVGARGGGSEQRRLETIVQIFDHLEITMSDRDVRERFGSTDLDPGESITFKQGRGGQVHGWRTVFKDEHIEAFKRVAGRQLIEIGYETDLDW